jgi:putative hydrolase of the HAD superfamily
MRPVHDFWIYTDADNTLWDTDALYANAQLALLSAAEDIAKKRSPSDDRLAFVRAYDQEIAAQHHSGLRYPPALLIRALVSGVDGQSVQDAARTVLSTGSVATQDESRALRAYSQILSGVPPILPSVKMGLELARDAGIPVYVVSEGSIELVRSRLRDLEIEPLTAGALAATKTAELYSRLIQRAAPKRAVMIGDQPDKDIQLAHKAGMLTILVHGRFRPVWTQAMTATGADTVTEDFLDAIKWVVKHNVPPPDRGS